MVDWFDIASASVAVICVSASARTRRSGWRIFVTQIWNKIKNATQSPNATPSKGWRRYKTVTAPSTNKRDGKKVMKMLSYIVWKDRVNLFTLCVSEPAKFEIKKL